MPDLREALPAWRARLEQLVAGSALPGAAVGISLNGERVVCTAGVENLRSGHPVTPATAFQLGSISKVYTATVLAAITELPDELLQRPVAELVPEAEWMEPEITVQRLLTHSSGLGGDYFADTGRGDDCLIRYVQQLQSLPRDVPLADGPRYSYCNSGYAVLGRLIELLTGMTFDAALRKHLLEPLGVEATTVLPEETLLRAHAMGHNRTGDQPMRADDVWHFARAADPIGGVCAPAEDLLTFAEMHLNDGRNGDGRQIISPAAARRMREHHLTTPPLTQPSARGLGWGVFAGERGEAIGHDGETLGQISRLRLLPNLGLALVVLTNGIPDGNAITREFEELVLGSFGHRRPQIAAAANGAASGPATAGTAPRPAPFDPAPYLGRYRNLEGLVEVTAGGRGLRLRSVQEAEGLLGYEDTTELIPAGSSAAGDAEQGAFIDAAESRPTSAVRFGDRDADGRCRSYFNGRVFWREPE